VSTRELIIGANRIGRWLAGFAERHGDVAYDATPERVVLTAADGARAACDVPFPPLNVNNALRYGGLLDHVERERRVGVVLVRRGGYAAGVFEGRRLLASKVGSRQVQGRTAAGGWSQQRFARRREKQAREAFQAAADVVARVLLPYADRLDAVLLGGDKAAVGQVLDDPRLERLRALVGSPHLNVPDPKLAVLRGTPDRFLAVTVHLTEPRPDDEGV
jgi:Actinobacteria/chloroflexi VLRF1 release factor